ncbi:5-hydroxytryptamine receptor 3A-like [Myripristis murdjan]|uniref:5-hydroxytryptamine receptor 3A-like n=1 Tax=Myripristis murdjan TaxID=586833 RepID=UPI0011760B8E|nr:5-hydroxytryptamine receptor 3A-like [Myripristis murdjan]
MLRRLSHSLMKIVFLLGSLKGCAHATSSNCTTRRCLAEKLISNNLTSQPQNENCTQRVFVPFIEYQTLSVDTKKLRFYSRLQAKIVWTDPQLAWNTSVYPHEKVVLPVKKIWTPELRITNAVTTTMTHSSRDLLVHSNGTVHHNVIINAEMDCEIRMFNYPFATDECPVAIQAWALDGCGMKLEMGNLWMIDSNHGDWRTEEASLLKEDGRDDRNYILVTLSLRWLNPFTTLILPSILIIVADVVSFALPLGGGERNSFKVTLLLSFTMFLIILNDQLPGDSQCSPIIRTHFCVCLVLLLVTLLLSMLFTRLAHDAGFLCCSRSKTSSPSNTADKEEKGDEESKTDISVIHLQAEEQTKMLLKVVNFLEDLNAKELENQKCQDLANKLDKICFWLYVCVCMIYFSTMTYMIINYQCEVNHFDFWY